MARMVVKGSEVCQNSQDSSHVSGNRLGDSGPEDNSEIGDTGGVTSCGTVPTATGGVTRNPGGPIGVKPGGTGTVETGDLD